MGTDLRGLKKLGLTSVILVKTNKPAIELLVIHFAYNFAVYFCPKTPKIVTFVGAT